jgi:hypothetical protein
MIERAAENVVTNHYGCLLAGVLALVLLMGLGMLADAPELGRGLVRGGQILQGAPLSAPATPAATQITGWSYQFDGQTCTYSALTGQTLCH